MNHEDELLKIFNNPHECDYCGSRTDIHRIIIIPNFKFIRTKVAPLDLKSEVGAYHLSKKCKECMAINGDK